MKRFICLIILPQFGKIQHITHAPDAEAARDRIHRAYPGRDVSFLYVGA